MEATMTYEELLQKLECPVCYTYISPPIRQCSKSHALCNVCFKKVSKCPVCRQDKVLACSQPLEKLYSTLDIPCQYKREGCSDVSKGMSIKNHEAACAYRPVACPTTALTACTWIGLRGTIGDHCKEKHPETIVFGTDSCLCATNFGQCSSCFLALLGAYDRVFRVYWDLDITTGTVRFCVTFLGSPEESSRFSFRLRFVGRRNSRITRSLQGYCSAVSDEGLLMDPECVVATNVTMIRGCRAVAEDFEFFVKIKKNFGFSEASGRRRNGIAKFLCL